MHRTLLATLAILIAITATTYAEVLVHEPFDYPAQGTAASPAKGGGVGGNGTMPKPMPQYDGGTGWAAEGNWVMIEGNPDGTFKVAAAYEAMPEGFTSSGGVAMLYRTSVERTLASPLKLDRTLFISFSSLDKAAYLNRGVEFRSADGIVLALRAKPRNQGGWYLQAGEQITDLAIRGTDLESVWLLRLEPKGETVAVSVARVVVDQGNLNSEPTYSKTVEIPPGTIDRVRLTQPKKANHMGDSTLTVDELRITTSFAEAVGRPAGESQAHDAAAAETRPSK